MNNEDSLASLGINLPEPIQFHKVRSGRKYLKFKDSPIALSIQYVLLDHVTPVTALCIRMIQLGTPEDELLLSGDKAGWDKYEKLFRKPKQFYPVFEHPASPKEVRELLQQDRFFTILANNLSAVYGIQVSPAVLEDSLCQLDPTFAKYYTESVRMPKQAIKL